MESPQQTSNLEQGPLEVRLTQATVRYSNLTAFAGAVITAALVWLLGFTLIPQPWGLRVALGVTAFAVATVLVDVLVLNTRERKFFSLGVTDDAVLLHRGRFIATDAAVLRTAIVSVDIQSGPLLRKFGLAKLVFRGIGRIPEIPPLTATVARDIQATLTRENATLAGQSGGA